MPGTRRRSTPTQLAMLWSFLLLALALTGCGSGSIESIREQQSAGNFEATLEPLRALLRERPDDAEVQFLYGRALAGTGEWSLAEWSLKEAMRDPEWLVPAGLQLADGALRTQNLPLAIETTDRLIEARPDDVDVRLMRANALAHSRLDNEETLAEVERVLELDPENVEVMEPKILALLALERIDEAAAAIEELGKRIEEADLGPEMAGWHCATAALFAEESGETERAEERWADCVERFPSHPNVIANATLFYDARAEFDRSLDLVRKAHELEPARRDYRVVLAQRLRAAGQADEAETLLREAAESEHPQLASSAWLDLAKHFQEVESYAAAAEAAGRAVEAARAAGQPLAQLLFEYADALLIAGEYERALAIADEMSVSAHQALIRGRVAQERDQPAEALAHYERAFELWPNNPWARYYAAMAAESVGDFDRAIEQYRYSIRIAADATDARQRLARLLLAEGRAMEARGMVSAGRAPMDLEGQLLALQLDAQTGNFPLMLRKLAYIQEALPEYLGVALARSAQGVHDRDGAEAVVDWLRRLDEETEVELARPEVADALRLLVRYSHETGRRPEAEATVREALGSHPESAPLHEVLGLSRELAGAPDEAEAAYRRALELEPGNARALTGLGRLALASDPSEALRHFEDAAARADAGDTEPQRGAARALAASGELEQAEARWEAVLKERPYDAEAAAQVAGLRLRRGETGDRTLERARRAVRFGGGPEALELLSQVYRGRDEIELADKAAARADDLRRAGRGEPPAEEAMGGKNSS